MNALLILAIFCVINAVDVNPSNSMSVFLFAMDGEKTKGMIPNDLLRSIYAFQRTDAWSRELITNRTVIFNEKPELEIVDFRGFNLRCLDQWDFSRDTVQRYDLSFNWLREVSDQKTQFSAAKMLRLNNNEIRRVDLRKTEIEALDLTCNEIANLSEHLFLPKTINTLSLMMNPIKSLKNYAFPRCYSSLSLVYCCITSLENIEIESRELLLTYNPIKTMKNVTLIGVKLLKMNNCDITFEILQAFDITFIGNCSWNLKGNPVLLRDLYRRRYEVPKGVREIIVGDGTY